MRISFAFGLAVCGLLAASAVRAQQMQAPADPSAILTMQRNQTAQLAASWLHSGDPRMEAWGAYVVLRDKHKELIPDLLALADAYEITGLPVLSPRRAQHDAMLSILDALIQLDPPISGDESRRLYPEFPAQSMILLSRAWIYPDSLDSSNRILLELFRTEHSQLLWLAAGNILAERKAEGFAAAVLGNMTVHMNLLVTTPFRSGGGLGSSNCGDRGAERPEDRAAWPEIGTYALTDPRSGATLLVDGADPSYYIRKVDRLYDRDIYGGGHCSDVIPYSWDAIRQHYLTRLLGKPQDEPALKISIDQRIAWANSEAYLSYLRVFVRQQQMKFAEVAGRLRDRHLMTEDEARGVKPRIEITIHDYRADKTNPLPRPDNLGDNVIVKM